MVQQVPAKPITTKPTPQQREIAGGIYFVIHPSFSKSNAVRIYGPEAELPDWSGSYMPDEVTRDFSRRMHFAAWRMSRCKDQASMSHWKSHYLNKWFWEIASWFFGLFAAGCHPQALPTT